MNSPDQMRTDQPDQGVPTAVAVNSSRVSSDRASRVRILAKPKTVRIILGGVLLSATVVYLGLLRPEGFGSYHDDGLYAVLGKALASGQGYKVISLPFEPDQTKSPPLYPFVLSLIWRLNPHFPQNVPWMMLLSVVATVLFLMLVWRYLVSRQYIGPSGALIIVTLAALNWRTIILATGVYSEMMYALLSVIALHLAERREEEEKGFKGGITVGVVMGLAFLARSSGIALPVAVVAYYLIKKRWRSAVVPAAVAGLFILAWLVWGHFHRPAVDSTNAGYYESYLSTLSQVLGGDGLGSKLASLLNLAAKNAVLLIVVTAPLVALGLNYDWTQNFSGALAAIGFVLFVMTFMFLIGGFFRFRHAGIRLLHTYVAVYVLIHILWPYAAYDRFLMPLLPFLLLFLLTEVKLLGLSAQKEFASRGATAKKFSAALISLVLVMLIGFVAYNVIAGIRTLHSSGKEKARFLEDQAAIQWLKNNAFGSDVVVCYRDPTYYLYTNLKTIRSISAREGGLTQDSTAAPDEQARVIFRIIDESNARFLVTTSTDFEQEDQASLQREGLKTLIEENRNRFVLVFESGDPGSRIYRIESGTS